MRTSVLSDKKHFIDISMLGFFDRIAAGSKYYTAILTRTVLSAENISVLHTASPRFALLIVCWVVLVFLMWRGHKFVSKIYKIFSNFSIRSKTHCRDLIYQREMKKGTKCSLKRKKERKKSAISEIQPSLNPWVIILESCELFKKKL